jgi:hypothetical protein
VSRAYARAPDAFGPTAERNISTIRGTLSDAYVVLVYAVVDDGLSRASPLGDALDVFVRREDAERSSRT